MKHGCIYVDSLPADAVEIPEYPGQFITPRGEIFARFGRLKRRRFGVNGCGYPICGLRRADGARVFRLVHRIVALLFVPGDHSLTVNHIDMDKANCAASNLEWVTHSENHSKGHAMKPEWSKNNGSKGEPLTATHPDTGERHEFASGRLAAQFVGNPNAAGNISKACTHGRAAYGFMWSKA